MIAFFSYFDMFIYFFVLFHFDFLRDGGGDAMALSLFYLLPAFISIVQYLYSVKYRILIRSHLFFIQIRCFSRSFIFPLLMKSRKPTPFLPFFFAFLTCLYNGILHGLYFVNFYHYKNEVWLYRPNFYIGKIFFLSGS